MAFCLTNQSLTVFERSVVRHRDGSLLEAPLQSFRSDETEILEGKYENNRWDGKRAPLQSLATIVIKNFSHRLLKSITCNMSVWSCVIKETDG